MNVSIFDYFTLEKASGEAKLKYEREHVTPYIYQHPELFEINIIEAEGKLKRPDLRLTVDTAEDLELIREIYKRLFRENTLFSIEDVINLIDDNPELKIINANIKQKELGNDR